MKTSARQVPGGRARGGAGMRFPTPRDLESVAAKRARTTRTLQNMNLNL